MTLDKLEDAVAQLAEDLDIAGWVDHFTDGNVVAFVKEDGAKAPGLLWMTLRLEGMVRTEKDWTEISAKIRHIFDVTKPSMG